MPQRLLDKPIHRPSVSQPIPVPRSEEWKDYYDVITKIGKGGFSIAASVRQKSSGLIFAAKKTNLLGLTFLNKKRALAEIKYHSQLEHPFIVKFYESFVQKAYIVIIMEYCEGNKYITKNNL